ncbi:MAG: nucleotidyltransferase family protein [Candidatus Aenigmarchaeota archaeon]|nr:nucleotidyltransferase family protein [Candidatus Aenigmarchaeota archaeon]
MKVIVLAGGMAERLKPLTENTAKPLIDIAGKPMINYVIESLDAAGIEDICVSTNEKFADEFEQWRDEYGLNVSMVIEKMPGGQKLGAIAGLAFVLEKKKIDDDCLVIAGDNLFGFSIADFVSFYKKKRAPVVGAYDVGDPNEAMRFGVITASKDGRITDFEEKPEKPKSSLVATACYILPKATLKMIPVYLKEGNSRDSPGHFLAWLTKKTAVYAYPFNSYWFDVGTFASLEAAKNFMSMRTERVRLL